MSRDPSQAQQRLQQNEKWIVPGLTRRDSHRPLRSQEAMKALHRHRTKTSSHQWKPNHILTYKKSVPLYACAGCKHPTENYPQTSLPLDSLDSQASSPPPPPPLLSKPASQQPRRPPVHAGGGTSVVGLRLTACGRAPPAPTLRRPAAAARPWQRCPRPRRGRAPSSRSCRGR